MAATAELRGRGATAERLRLPGKIRQTRVRHDVAERELGDHDLDPRVLTGKTSFTTFLGTWPSAGKGRQAARCRGRRASPKSQRTSCERTSLWVRGPRCTSCSREEPRRTSPGSRSSRSQCSCGGGGLHSPGGLASGPVAVPLLRHVNGRARALAGAPRCGAASHACVRAASTCDLRVAEDSLHGRERDARLEEQRRCGVPEVVQRLRPERTRPDADASPAPRSRRVSRLGAQAQAPVRISEVHPRPRCPAWYPPRLDDSRA
jgi:hypothetical protein